MTRIGFFFVIIMLSLVPVSAQTPQRGTPYDIGNPTLIDIWVDPVNGSDNNDGATRETAMRTVWAAWSRIPKGETLTTGYQLLLMPGSYAASTLPSYWESRYGTYDAPIILRPAAGAGTVTLPAINVYDTRYLYLLDLTLEAAGIEPFHCDTCDHILIRGTTIRGLGSIENRESPRETVKFNQSQHVYFEDNDFSHAYQNPVDFVAVQYGHILNNRIHDAGDWCIYLKGGSAYFTIAGNEIYDCWTGGFTAGEGTGFEFMVAPWLHYEAYDIKFVNNVIHDTYGAGMGVNGGYNILLAHNTLYRVGQRSHALEFIHGLRICNGNTNACARRLEAGGWGIGETGVRVSIPSRNVYVYNNLLYNPPGYEAEWQHLTIFGAREAVPGSNVPNPVLADDNLQIRGNVIWNGSDSMPLGIEARDQGCQPDNPTCNAPQLRAENTINLLEPQLVAPDYGDYRVIPQSIAGAPTYPIPDFTWDDAPTQPAAPAGELSNHVPLDRDGNPRGDIPLPGAYAG